MNIMQLARQINRISLRRTQTRPQQLVTIRLVKLIVHLVDFRERVTDQFRVPGDTRIELFNFLLTKVGLLRKNLSIQPDVSLRYSQSFLLLMIAILHTPFSNRLTLTRQS